MWSLHCCIHVPEPVAAEEFAGIDRFNVIYCLSRGRAYSLEGEMWEIVVSLWVILAIFLVACTGEPETPEVTFDGKGCTYSGPTELVTGDHSFVYKDSNDQEQVVWASRIPDGYTYQDELDLQSEPGEFLIYPLLFAVQDDTA